MKIVKSLFVLALVLAHFSCGSQSDAVKLEDPEKIVTQFLEIYSEEGVDQGLKYLFEYNPWINNFESLSTRLLELTSQIGMLKGSDLIVTKKIGNAMIMFSYLMKYERQPIRFNITFYRPGTNWQVQDFRYDDELIQELISSGEAYRLKENIPDY